MNSSESDQSEFDMNTPPDIVNIATMATNWQQCSFRTAVRKIFGIRRVRSTDKDFPSKLVWKNAFRETSHDFYNSPTIDKHIRKARSIASTLLSTREFNDSLFQINPDEDDDVMKMKLFRLMYESVKDSDLKIKRAELVKADFENNSSFDLGYVFGDASDKLNVMVDISKTLKRMFDTWRPVEHVNAYEQIANLAIEVTHLADMVRAIKIADANTVGPA